ncbi:TcpQ domain-containing protein [Photorhabdus sp. RM71S]|uniref:TcpQ domain-containing protein n=1 Tax=Photorhabdus sp. RM71S TaxID=3342824 RepID=UPI0036D98F3A
MKQHTVISLGLLLSGCATMEHLAQPDIPAGDVVGQLMSEHTEKVSFVQQQLSRVLRPVHPSPYQSFVSTTKSPPEMATSASVPSRLVINPFTASATKATPVPSFPSHAVKALPALTYIGERPDIPSLAVAGKAATLNMAIARIIPKDWTIHFDMGLKPQVKHQLNWSGNDQWPYILNRLLVHEKLKATVDWSSRKVSVSDGTATIILSAKSTADKVVKPAKRNPFASQSTPSKKTASAVTARITLPGAAGTSRIWVMTTGSTLKDSLLTWSTKEKCSLPNADNWTVQWLTPVNYRIDAPLVFRGTFMDALNDVFRLYLNASVPLYAGTRTQQCQVIVSDKEP